MAKASPRHNSNELQTNEWVPFLLQFSSIHNYFIVTLSIVIRCNIQHVRKTLTLEWVFLIKYSITRKRIKSSLPLSFAITIETITNFFFPPLTPHTFSSSASLLCWVQMWGKFNQNRARVLLFFLKKRNRYYFFKFIIVLLLGRLVRSEWCAVTHFSKEKLVCLSL